ncbi:MAG: hypothetical protein J7L89_01775, partial [Bacteroidales bacterium]|nr:hypothetical protein [Bacteroidales bacterium]
MKIKSVEQYTCPMRCEGDKVYNEPGNCPVCHMHLVQVNEHKEQVEAHHTHHHHDHDMHLKKEKNNKPANGIYTCPMHPEIRENHPGICPKCGMDLLPEKGIETSEEELAYKRMAKKFWIALVLSVPVFIIAMSDFFSFLQLENLASKKVWGWVEFALATPVVFYSGWTFFKRGWNSVLRWSPNM